MKSFKDRIRSCDKHGTPITIYYKRKTTNQSYYGGLVSLMVTVIAIGYFIYQVALVFNRDDYRVL